MRSPNRATIQPLNTFFSKPSLQNQSIIPNPSPKSNKTQIFTNQSSPVHPKLMSISSSFRLFSVVLPHHPQTHIFKPIKIQSLPLNLTNYFVFRPITFEKLPKKSIFASSSSSSSAVSLQPIEELPPKLQEIVKLFQAVDQPKQKYEQLLFYGTKLNPVDNRYKTSENKVQGCVSQVWVRAYLDANRNVIFEADSDSQLTKGLAALLVQGLSGRPVEEIVRVTPDFVVLLGLQQSLTPSRNNGFLNMLKLMQKKALQLYVESEKANGSSREDMLKNTTEENSIVGADESRNKDLSDAVSYEEGDRGPGLDSGDGGVLGSRGMRIMEALERGLKPIELVVEDISYQHAGHPGVKGSDGETHFNVKVVSEEFEGKSLVKRHRLIYGLLQDELQSGLHALSIVAKTPSEVGSV